jgi:hypothetical protein
MLYNMSAPVACSSIVWCCAFMYKVVQIWPGQTVTSLQTISPGHIWTTLYNRAIRWSRNYICSTDVQVLENKLYVLWDI